MFFIILDDNIYGIHSQRVNILYILYSAKELGHPKYWDTLKIGKKKTTFFHDPNNPCLAE